MKRYAYHYYVEIIGASKVADGLTYLDKKIGTYKDYVAIKTEIQKEFRNTGHYVGIDQICIKSLSLLN